MNILTQLMSWPFTVGLFIGYGGRLLFCRYKVYWLDRYRPLQDGFRREAPRVNRTWIGALLALAMVAWSIYQIEVTAHRTDRVTDDAKAFSAQVQACQKDFNNALRWRTQIQSENDALAARDRAALRQWLATLLNPPPDIKQLDPNDPIRQAWGIGVTENYMSWARTIEEQRQHNEDERRAHPLPEPTCGK
jgi:hypothetical protein